MYLLVIFDKWPLIGLIDDSAFLSSSKIMRREERYHILVEGYLFDVLFIVVINSRMLTHNSDGE